MQGLLTGPEMSGDPDGAAFPPISPRSPVWAPRHLWCCRSAISGSSPALSRLGERFDLMPTEEDRDQMRRLADQAAVALANARMLEQVRELAYYDSLTGLPNRLSYKERLSYALEQASRNQRLVAAFFIDLDHFSRINDTLGP